MIENYLDNPNGIAEAYLNILEKYKKGIETFLFLFLVPT